MHRFFVAALAGTMLAATPALAADEGGAYVGAGVGNYGVDVGAFSGDDTGYKVFAGWMLNPWLGGELEYLDGGSAEESGAGLDMTGFNASLKAVYPIDQFSLFAKAGLYLWDADVRIAGEGRGSDSGEDFSWGIGVGYDFTDNFGVTVEYQGFEVEDTDTTDFVSASVVWKF
ncbi:MAG TPA: outer membrane beta-barrel protein [Steroidobacteraceae bacterium]|nr:outer membrane beta-barrel protein [Steroidobacteraceae bacterium]